MIPKRNSLERTIHRMYHGHEISLSLFVGRNTGQLTIHISLSHDQNKHAASGPLYT